jgi:hypothetical protein
MDRLDRPLATTRGALPAERERRVTAFLRGFAIEDERALRALARRLAALVPSGQVEALEAAAAAWFARLLDGPNAKPDLALALGRVAWLAAGAGKHWPMALLAHAPPAEFTRSVRAALPALPPPHRDDAMPAANLEPVRLRDLVRWPARLLARNA